MTIGSVIFGDLYRENSRNGIYKKKEFQGRGTPIIKMNELFENRIIHPEDFDLDRFELTSKEKDRFNLQDFDLLFARTSVVPDGVGKCSIVKNIKGDVAFESNIIRARLDEKKSNPVFLFYYFQSPAGRSKVLSIANGAAIRTIRGSDLINIDVPASPLETQKCIALTLSNFDNLILNNRRRIALLEEAARLLYREWFVHFRFPGAEHVRKVDGVPEGWTSATLGKLVDLVKETVKPENFGADDVHIGLEHIPRRSFTLSDWEPMEGLASQKFRFAENDILFGKIRPYFHKVGFALRPGLVSSDAFVWRVKDTKHWPIVVCATSSDHFVSVASKTVREGSKMPRADWKVLIDYKIVIPPDGIRDTFNDIIFSLTTQCKTLALENKQLVKARDLLLPRLMDGRLEV